MELLAASAEEAAFFLDAALSARKSSRGQSSQEARRNSHFLFTLHLYQERADKSNKAARECVQTRGHVTPHVTQRQPITELRSLVARS